MSKPEPETDRGPTFTDLLTELIEIAGRPDVSATASVLLMDLAGALRTYSEAKRTLIQRLMQALPNEAQP